MMKCTLLLFVCFLPARMCVFLLPFPFLLLHAADGGPPAVVNDWARQSN